MTKKKIVKHEDKWVNPVGGYGDMLMISGVMKLAFDRNPGQRYKLIRRTRYSSVLKGHPAIEEIGFPPKDAHIINTGYWMLEEVGGGTQRPFQILARAFGVPTPVEETLYFPGQEEPDTDDLLFKIIPWKKKNVIISHSSESPRKMMNPIKWDRIVHMLLRENVLVLQVGTRDDLHIKGSYSLLGLTTPKQLVSLVKKVNLVITADNFIMHAAHLTGVPAIVIFGPTPSEVAGYPEQILFQASRKDCKLKDECLGARFPQNYSTPCPFVPNYHCLDEISEQDIFQEVLTIL
jgi:ADP-heptose:LPS heptosyltransferase